MEGCKEILSLKKVQLNLKSINKYFLSKIMNMYICHEVGSTFQNILSLLLLKSPIYVLDILI